MSLKKLKDAAKGLMVGMTVNHLMRQKSPIFNLRIEEKNQAIHFDSNTLIPFAEFTRLAKLKIGQPIFLHTTEKLIEVKFTFAPDKIVIGKYDIGPGTFCTLLLDLMNIMKFTGDEEFLKSMDEVNQNFYSIYSQKLQQESQQSISDQE